MSLYAVVGNGAALERCSLVFDQVSSVVNKLSSYRKKDITKAWKILNSWEKVSLGDYIQSHSFTEHREVFLGLRVSGRPQGVLGRIQLIESSKDFIIVVVKDRENRLHIIDLNVKDLLVYFSKSTKSIEEINFIRRYSSSFFYKVDIGRLQSEYNSANDFHRKENIKLALEKSINYERLTKLKSIYKKIGDYASYGAFPTMVFWGGTGIARALGYGVDNFVLQHASNYYFGLVGMALLHGGFSYLSIKNRFKILLGAVSLNFSLNIIEEVDLMGLGRISNGANTKVGSDWVDFSAGMLSVGTYLSAVATIEVINYIRYQNKAKGL